MKKIFLVLLIGFLTLNSFVNVNAESSVDLEVEALYTESDIDLYFEELSNESDIDLDVEISSDEPDVASTESNIDLSTEILSAETEIALDEEVEASDLDVGNPRLLPGHPFYFLKNWTRNIKSIITFDPVKRASLEAEFANEKLIELKKMVESNMSEDRIEECVEDYKKRIQKTEELTAKIKVMASENENVRNFSEQFTQHQILHNRILLKLEEQVPEGVFEKIEEVRNEHLDKFQAVLSNIENREDIPERLIDALDKIEGSDFKEIKDIEILNKLKEKLPEQLIEKMEDRIEEKTESLKERLESLPLEEQKKFQEYIKNISGDEEVHLNIIDNVGSKVLSEGLEKTINIAREKALEKIKEKIGTSIDSNKIQEEFTTNENLLENVKVLILEKGLDKTAMPEVFQLIEKAEIDLDKAEAFLNEGNYSEAFGEIKSSFSLSTNTENLIQRIAGFDTSTISTDNELTIMCNDIVFPVCGVNGKTYRNICEAKKEGVGIAYRGECEEQTIGCAGINEQVNRNPLIGPTNQKCCEGLEEFRVSKSYSICKESDNEFECITNEDCPLPKCPGEESRCIDGQCFIPRCTNEVVCIQVITPAESPDGICKEFSTPCDVPIGWVRVNACESKMIQLKDSDKQEQIMTQVLNREEAIRAEKEQSGEDNQGN